MDYLKIFNPLDIGRFQFLTGSWRGFRNEAGKMIGSHQMSTKARDAYDAAREKYRKDGEQKNLDEMKKIAEEQHKIRKDRDAAKAAVKAERSAGLAPTRSPQETFGKALSSGKGSVVFNKGEEQSAMDGFFSSNHPHHQALYTSKEGLRGRVFDWISDGKELYRGKLKKKDQNDEFRRSAGVLETNLSGMDAGILKTPDGKFYHVSGAFKSARPVTEQKAREILSGQ